MKTCFICKHDKEEGEFFSARGACKECCAKSYDKYKALRYGESEAKKKRDLHHLAKVNGVWCFRWTLPSAGGSVGKRTKVSLGAVPIELKDEEEVLKLAVWARDKICTALERAGVTETK